MYFYFFLFLLFLSDIFFFNRPFEAQLVLTSVIPAFFLAVSTIRKKSIFVPKISVFYLLFLIFSGLSFVFSVDKHAAFENILIYISAFFIFIYSYNNREKLKENVHPFLIYSSVIYILIFYLDKLFGLNLFTTSANLFYSYGHNQLGSLLVPTLIFTSSNFLSIVLFIFVFLSQSRAALLSLIFLDKRNLNIFIIIAAIFSIIIITTNLGPAKNKKIFGLREVYFSHAIDSIREKPFFGVGPGNFYFAAAKRQTDYNEYTTTAHNIILEILTENGIIAGGSFLLFLFLALRRAKKDAYFRVVLALMTIFMLDFSYRYNSFLALWFFFLGLITVDKKPAIFLDKKKTLILIVFGLVLLGGLAIVVKKTNYENFIITTQKQAYYFDVAGDREEALRSYQKTLNLYPFKIVTNGEIIDRILALNMDIYGSYLGKKKTAAMLDNIVNEPAMKNSRGPIFSKVKAFCLDNGLRCYNIKDEKN